MPKPKVVSVVLGSWGRFGQFWPPGAVSGSLASQGRSWGWAFHVSSELIRTILAEFGFPCLLKAPRGQFGGVWLSLASSGLLGPNLAAFGFPCLLRASRGQFGGVWLFPVSIGLLVAILAEFGLPALLRVPGASGVLWCGLAKLWPFPALRGSWDPVGKPWLFWFYEASGAWFGESCGFVSCVETGIWPVTSCLIEGHFAPQSNASRGSNQASPSGGGVRHRLLEVASGVALLRVRPASPF